MILLSVFALLLLVNILTYLLFAVDKRRAEQGAWRISEVTLLTYAALGGSPAAKLGQRRLRHKTRKQPFARRLNRICLIQIALIGLLLLIGAATLWRAMDSPVTARTAPAPLLAPEQTARPPAGRRATW